MNVSTFFSKEMMLTEFVEKHYNSACDYRLTLDTRNNSLVYADMEYIRVPEFKECLSIPFTEFSKMMEERDWTWLQDSRFKYLYVYLIEEDTFVCDRDNLEIKDFREEYFRLENAPKASRGPSHKWLSKRVGGVSA